MQSVSARIWARVAVFISYDDNHYTTGTSFILLVIISSRFLAGIIFDQLVSQNPREFCASFGRILACAYTFA